MVFQRACVCVSASVCVCVCVQVSVSVSRDLWVDLEVRGHPSERGDLNHLILVGGERSCRLGGDWRWLCREIRHTVNTHKHHNTSRDTSKKGPKSFTVKPFHGMAKWQWANGATVSAV